MMMMMDDDDDDDGVPFTSTFDKDLLLPLLVPPPLPAADGGVSPIWVYLDSRAYIAPEHITNATTASSTTRNGIDIHVSFCLATPPRLSYLCVHCPRPGGGGYQIVLDPQVISTHADLALLRVPLPNDGLHCGFRSYDFFVYTARPRPGASSLHRLPNPHASPFSSNAVSILRCSANRYVIAALMHTLRGDMEFNLQRYDSDIGHWTSTPVLVDKPQRDTVLPIPDTATELLFHDTTKVITLGGPRGTIGWVDLWRGILLCDVLDKVPVLRDLPLPKPARRNRSSFCRGCPHSYRDITVVLQDASSCIKYVEMETRPGDPPPSQRRQPQHSDDDSGSEEKEQKQVAYYWKANIWSMPIPVGSWEDWHKEFKLDVTDIAVDKVKYSELLPKIGIDPEETLRRLMTGQPTLAMDGSAISFLSKINYMDDKGWIVYVGLKNKALQNVVELDHRKNSSFMRYYITTDISKYLIKATGETGTLVKTGVMIQGRRKNKSGKKKEQIRQTAMGRGKEMR